MEVCVGGASSLPALIGMINRTGRHRLFTEKPSTTTAAATTGEKHKVKVQESAWTEDVKDKEKTE